MKSVTRAVPEVNSSSRFTKLLESRELQTGRPYAIYVTMTLLLCLVFFLSGASALIFETLWFHQAGLAFGNSVWASSLVLSGFMGGLAVGSAAAIWKGDRLGAPVRTYALLEIVVATSGVALVILLPWLGTATTPLLRPLVAHPWILNPARFLVAFACLLVPSTAMGLTLPLLTRALVAADPNFGRALGRLYGWNTLGAVLGTIAAETYLIETLGVHGSALAAGSLNLLVAGGAVFLSGSFLEATGSTCGWIGGPTRWTRGAPWLTAAFLSGFALLALEVVWFRFLLLFVIGTSLSFAAMLAVVLGGIALGGSAASFWLRKDMAATRYTVAVSLASGLLCATTYVLFPLAVAPFGQESIAGLLPVLRVALPLMFPVSLLSGVFFTLAGAALRSEYPSAATTTGALTLANTAGAALGALCAGFVFLPALGMELSFFVVAVLYGAIGLVVLAAARTPRRVLYPVAVPFILILALFPFGSMAENHLSTAAGRWSGGRQWSVMGFREGIAETVFYVEELLFGKRQHLRLVTNSFSMSTTEFHARRYMKLYVYLPVAIHPDPRQALLISYGVGSTAKALVDTPSLDEIDVVDISRDILEMSSIVFPDSSDNPLYDPRITVHVEDGRYFLATTEEEFDLITSEPPPPQMAEVVNLYTREYFQLMYDRLRDGGFVTYWLPLHSLSEGSAKSIIRAFLDVFPDASLWNGWREDLMLFGTRNARGPVSEDWFERQWHDPAVANEMAALGLEAPEQLGALFIGDAEYLREMTRDQPPLVDNFPRRIISRSEIGPGLNSLYPPLMDTDAARDRFAHSPLIARLWPRPLADRTLPYFEYQRTINALLDLSGHPLSKNIADLHVIVTKTSLTAPILWHMGSHSDAQRALETLTSEERAAPEWQYQLAARLISQRRFDDALDPLRNAENNAQLYLTARMFRVYALCLAQRMAEARSVAAETYLGPGNDPRLQGWWDFLDETFGIEPRLSGR